MGFGSAETGRTNAVAPGDRARALRNGMDPPGRILPFGVRPAGRPDQQCETRCTDAVPEVEWTPIRWASRTRSVSPASAGLDGSGLRSREPRRPSSR